MDSTFGAAISGLLGTIVALALVLGLAYVCLRALRRWQDRGFVRDPNEPERRLRFVRALPLGQRERLVLVEAEGELLLVGVSAGAISLIRNYGETGGARFRDGLQREALQPAASDPLPSESRTGEALRP